MDRILLPVDGGEAAQRATRFAARLVRALPATEVFILNVQPPLRDWHLHGVTHEFIALHLAQDARHILQAAQDILTDAGVDAVAEYRHGGDPAETIADVARERQSTHIVMASRGRGRVTGLALGSTTIKVIHLAAVPVTVVK